MARSGLRYQQQRQFLMASSASEYQLCFGVVFFKLRFKNRKMYQVSQIIVKIRNFPMYLQWLGHEKEGK